MRCKAGELAIVVKVGPQTTKCLGLVVRVVAFGGETSLGHAAWVVEPQVFSNLGHPIPLVEDCCLHPMRGGDSQDNEVAGKPAKEIA